MFHISFDVSLPGLKIDHGTYLTLKIFVSVNEMDADGRDRRDSRAERRDETVLFMASKMRYPDLKGYPQHQQDLRFLGYSSVSKLRVIEVIRCLNATL